MLLALLTAASLLTAPQQDTVLVTASFTSPRIAVGGTTTLVVQVEARGIAASDIRVPDLPPALQVLGTSDYSGTSIGIPGGRTRTTRREITVLATAPGVYRLGRVIVRSARGVHRSEELQLIVSGSAPAGPGEVTTGRSSLRASVTPDTVFVGQQVLLQAEVTFAEDFRMRQSRPATFDPPAPSGFWIQDLPDPITIALRVRDGRSVETQTYRRAYFPLNSGEYRMPPARLHYEVRRGFLYPPETRELVSDSPAVVVLPLPDAVQPASFTGAVGRLTLRASVAPQQVRVGEAAVLTVEIEGTGNVKALPEPRRPQVERAEVFPPTQESAPSFDDDVVGGTKRFRWMVVAEETGIVVIPPIEYAVFDPELRTYVVLRSDSLRFEARPGIVVAAQDTALRPLRRASVAGRFGFVRSPAFAAAQALPLALLAGALLLRRRRSMPPGPRDEARATRTRLDALVGRPADAIWLAELERTLRDAVLRVAGLDGEPVAQLRAAGLTDAADRLARLLAELSTLRYAPGARVHDARMLADARAFVEALIPRARRRSAAGAVVFLLMAAGGAVVARQDDPFDRGTAAFDAGDHAGAARAFRQHTQAHPEDAAGWQNLGLSAMRAGDPGMAAWAWLRGVQWAPRDDGLRHDLRVIGAASALAAVLPPDRLAPTERALLLSAGWWLLLLGLSAAVLRHRRAAVALAAPGTLALLVGLIGLAAAEAGPRRVTAMGQGIAVHAAPTTREEALARLEPGVLAEVIEIRDRWLLVRTPGGTSGWVERSAVAEP